MQQRRRRLAVGMALVASVTAGAWSVGTDGPQREVAAAQPPSVPEALASVGSDGLLATGEPAWHAVRLDVGTYLLQFPAETSVVLRTWTAVARVATRPVSATAWTVTFTGADRRPVDSAFTFAASPVA